MNIFYLDEDLKKCAKYHLDKHVIKMILEHAQILCSALILRGAKAPYKLTHQKHPCVLWASKSLENWIWLKKLTKELNKEFKYRWDKKEDHKSYKVILELKNPEKFIPSLGITERPQAMPEEYKIKGNPIKAYRKYYFFDKLKFLKYTKRKIPYWLKIKNFSLISKD